MGMLVIRHWEQMRTKKPKQYEDEPEPNYINGTGQLHTLTEGKRKVKTRQIGFIRQSKPTKAVRLLKRPKVT